MKYLKTYESLGKFYGDSKNTDTHKLINWNLIEDVKDMALEYIDDGYTLIIGVNIIQISRGKKIENTPVIYYLNYNHDKIEEHMDSDLFNYWSTQDKKIIDNIIVDYSIFFDPVTSHGRFSYINSVHISQELRDRVKLAYPNERIV
jgi:hypothetical protein